MKLGVVMDPIEDININKDTTFELMLNAEQMGWEVHYMEPKDIYAEPGELYGRLRHITVKDEEYEYYKVIKDQQTPLAEMDVILMRVDPPVDLNYCNLCQLLDHPGRRGSMVVNSPHALRSFNEKLTSLVFYDLMPPSIVTNSREKLEEFMEKNSDIVVKPTQGMGGAGIFRVTKGDPNSTVILDTMFAENNFLMAQIFLPEVVDGDKRVLIVHGEVIPYTLARIPPQGEFRGNLAAGGKGVVMPIERHEQVIARKVARWLQRRGVFLAGIDIIGNYLTEINITSPTCMREIERDSGYGIAHMFFDQLRVISDKRRQDYKVRIQKEAQGKKRVRIGEARGRSFARR